MKDTSNICIVQSNTDQVNTTFARKFRVIINECNWVLTGDWKSAVIIREPVGRSRGICRGDSE